MAVSPVNLAAALATFDQAWSPRIVATMNDYDVRVAHVDGEHVWHTHDATDELFLLMAGELRIDLREVDGERTVVLHPGEVFVVPRGIEHKPSGHGDILLVEPTGTVTTGDVAEAEVPAHVHRTAGQVVSA